MASDLARNVVKNVAQIWLEFVGFYFYFPGFRTSIMLRIWPRFASGRDLKHNPNQTTWTITSRRIWGDRILEIKRLSSERI